MTLGDLETTPPPAPPHSRQRSVSLAYTQTDLTSVPSPPCILLPDTGLRSIRWYSRNEQLTKEEGKTSSGSSREPGSESRVTWAADCSFEPQFPRLPKRNNNGHSQHCYEVQMRSCMKGPGPHWQLVIGDFLSATHLAHLVLNQEGKERGRAREVISEPAYFQPGAAEPCS